MFQIVKTHSYFWPVPVEFPDGDGKTITEEFEIEFKRVDQAAIDAYLGDTNRDSLETLREIVLGWRGVRDGDSDLPFTPENFTRLLQFPQMGRFIGLAWIRSVTGDAARRKN